MFNFPYNDCVEGMTTPSSVTISKHLRKFTSMRISSWTTGAIETTTESGHFLTSTSKPNVTTTNLQPGHTNQSTPLTGSPSAPPVGNASPLHTSTVKSTGSSCTENPSTRPETVTGRKIVTSVIKKNNSTTVTTPGGKLLFFKKIFYQNVKTCCP